MTPVCYVDDALHHQPENGTARTPGAGGLNGEFGRWKHVGQEPLVVQQGWFAHCLTARIGRLQRQISPTSTCASRGE